MRCSWRQHHTAPLQKPCTAKRGSPTQCRCNTHSTRQPGWSSQPLRQPDVFVHLDLSCVPRSHQHLRGGGEREAAGRASLGREPEERMGGERSGYQQSKPRRCRPAAARHGPPGDRQRSSAQGAPRGGGAHLAAGTCRRQCRLPLRRIPQAVAALVPQRARRGAHALDCGGEEAATGCMEGSTGRWGEARRRTGWVGRSGGVAAASPSTHAQHAHRKAGVPA